MGYYINQTSTGKALPSVNKAQFLLDNEPGTTKVDGKSFQENLVCVVENGFFDAAGYCYSDQEYEDWKHPDGRRRTWLVVPSAATIAE